jgi:hypothetical protein
MQGQPKLRQAVVNRINFARGRIYPTFELSASAGTDVYKADRLKVRFQIDGQNLTNVVDVIEILAASSRGTLSAPHAVWPYD